jgi:hypothetical protein
MPHQWFSTDQRNMQRTMFAYEINHAAHQRIPTKVTQLAQRSAGPQMGIPIGVTSGTS